MDLKEVRAGTIDHIRKRLGAAGVLVRSNLRPYGVSVEAFPQAWN